MPDQTMPLSQPASAPGDTISLHFLAEDAQPRSEVAGMIAEFIDDAKTSLDIALYDCHLSDPQSTPIREALERKRQAGIPIRLVYDSGTNKPQDAAQLANTGTDLGLPNTGDRVRDLGLPPELSKPAKGFGALMHQKVIIRDGKDIWTGSLNWSDDAFGRMENTIVRISSPEMAGMYAQDFAQIWEKGNFERSGKLAVDPYPLRFGGRDVTAGVSFSPGWGEEMNVWVARQIAAAKERVVICAMLISSSAILRAIDDQLNRGQVEFSGVHDRTQTSSVLHQWREAGDHLAWKRDALQRLISEGKLVGKQSKPFVPGESQNFMHNKTIVIDDIVVTGSYNFSHAAESNSENMIAVQSPEMAEVMVDYIAEIGKRLQANPHGSAAGQR